MEPTEPAEVEPTKAVDSEEGDVEPVGEGGDLAPVSGSSEELVPIEQPEDEVEAAGADDGNDGDSGHPDETTTGFEDPDDSDKEEVDLNKLAIDIQKAQYVDLPRLKAEFGEDSDEVWEAERRIEEDTAELRMRYLQSLDNDGAEVDDRTPATMGEQEPDTDSLALPDGVPEVTEELMQAASELLIPVVWPDRYVPIDALRHNAIEVAPDKSFYLGPMNPLYDPFVNPDVALDTKAIAKAMDVARIDQLEMDIVRNTELGDSDNLYDIIYKAPTEELPGNRAIVLINRDFLMRWQSSWQQYMEVVKLQDVDPRDPTQLLRGLNRMIGGAISELAMRKPEESVITQESGHNYTLTPKIVWHNFTSRTQRLHIFVNRPSGDK